jgi:hypothetical protein
VLATNEMRAIAQADAGIYREPPERPLEMDGDPLPPEDERAALWSDILAGCSLDRLMPEVERRSNVARNVVIAGTWVIEPDGDESGHGQLRMYWGSDVLVVPHPRYPDSDAHVISVGLRQHGKDSDGKPWWVVFSREPTDEADGSVTFGPWWMVRLSEGGQQDVSATPVEYEGSLLPVVFLRNGEPDGYFFVDEGRDLPSFVDAINCSRSNEVYTLDLQGHSQAVATGRAFEGNTTVLSPDVIVHLPDGAQLTTVTFSPAMEDMREGRRVIKTELATSRSNSPDAYAPDEGVPLSGVSRAIRNAPKETALDERRHIFVDFEENRLLPMIADIAVTFGKHTSLVDLTPRCRMRKVKDFEDLEAKQRRLLDLRDAGLISDAEVLVELGMARDVAEATARLEAMPPKRSASSLPPAPGAMAVALTAQPKEDDKPVDLAEPAAAAAAGEVQSTALNGAQVESLKAIIVEVAAGTLPADTARALMRAAFPVMPVEQIDEMLSGLEGFTPATEPTA